MAGQPPKNGWIATNKMAGQPISKQMAGQPTFKKMAGQPISRQMLYGLHAWSSNPDEGFQVWQMAVVARACALTGQRPGAHDESHRSVLLRAYEAQQAHQEYWATGLQFVS